VVALISPLIGTLLDHAARARREGDVHQEQRYQRAADLLSEAFPSEGEVADAAKVEGFRLIEILLPGGGYSFELWNGDGPGQVGEPDSSRAEAMRQAFAAMWERILTAT
jgi:hypothetical protein